MSHARAEPANEVSKPDIERVLAQALGFLRAGQTRRALDCLAARTDLAWDHSFACYLAGLIRVNLGQDAAALPFYDRSLALNPEYAEAIEARARLLQRAEKWEEAIAAYDALLRFQPAKALTAKAAILHGLGRNEEALQTYRQLIATSPDDAAAWYNCGAILATRGEQAEAYDHFQKALECDPGYGLALYGAATALQKLGR